MRTTRQKQTLQKAIEKQKSFFTAEDIKKQLPDISLATIYRYLKNQKKNNQIYSYTCNKRQVYSKEKKSHCHFICEKTGKVIHFDIDSLDFLKDKIPGTITSFQIEVKGVCDGCSSQKLFKTKQK